MSRELYEALMAGQAGDSAAVYCLIQKFDPLIKKYGHQLGYYCAESDLIIFMLELLNSIDLSCFADGGDGQLVNYINRAIKNKKVDLYRKNVRCEQDIIHLEEDAISTYITNPDNQSAVEWADLLKELPEKQRDIIILKFIKGYSDVEIALQLKISRQAVNRLKNRALGSLKKTMEESNGK